QERVPVRQDRHADQAGARQLRRRARRDRLRVPGQRERGALHAAHQRVHARTGPAGAAVPPLVRPYHCLPHLLHPVEPAARDLR
ncbi:hypothetical protein ACJX0J_033717, partial [Zea mays]